MVKLGQYNLLRVIKKVDFGFYLDGDENGDILLPRKYAHKNTAIGDSIEVFIYLDSEDRIVATTLKPKALVGECAYLKVVEVNRIGAFMDWGLPKDLLVPFNQQQKPMQKGYSYTVYVYVDDLTERIAASSRLEDFLTDDPDQLKPNQAVDLMRIMPHVDATGLLVHTPVTHGHIITIVATPKKKVTKEEIVESFREHPRMRVVRIEDGFNSNTAMFQYGRYLGKPRGDLYEIAVFEETIGFSGDDIMFAINIPQESVVVPETMDAIRAAIPMQKERLEGLALTNQYLGMG